MLKLYIHYNSLQAFQKGNWVNARFQFIGQDDIELILSIKDIVTSYQQNGFTIRKKKWYEKLLRLKSLK